MQQKQLVTPAEYARLRKLNRSTICRQIRDGAIPSENGLINPEVADQARKKNLNQTRCEQAARRKQAKRAEQSPEDTAPDANHDAHLAVVDALRRIVAPSEVLQFARVVRALGCTLEQSYGAGLWHGIQAGLAVTEVSVEDVEDFEEPTRAQWRRALGKELDFAAADVLYGEATGPEFALSKRSKPRGLNFSLGAC